MSWAFGGALALAYATHESRGTGDIATMVDAGSLDVEVAARRSASLLAEDARIERLRHLGER